MADFEKFTSLLLRVLAGMGAAEEEVKKFVTVVQNVVKNDPTFDDDLEALLREPQNFVGWFTFVTKHAKSVQELGKVFHDNHAVREFIAQFIQRF